MIKSKQMKCKKTYLQEDIEKRFLANMKSIKLKYDKGIPIKINNFKVNSEQKNIDFSNKEVLSFLEAFRNWQNDPTKKNIDLFIDEI